MTVKKNIFLVIAITGLYITQGQASKLYKVIDEYGNVSYQARPAPLDPGIISEEKDFTSHPARVDNSLKGIARKHPVVIYSTPNCANCDTARKFMDSLKIPYTDKNAQGNREVSEELRRLSGALTVPVITVGKKVLQGFTRPWLESELEKVGYPIPKKKSARQ